MNLFIYFEIGLNAQLFNNNFFKETGLFAIFKDSFRKIR